MNPSLAYQLMANTFRGLICNNEMGHCLDEQDNKQRNVQIQSYFHVKEYLRRYKLHSIGMYFQVDAISFALLQPNVEEVETPDQGILDLRSENDKLLGS